ncbi:MAG: hypothetical protein A3F82_04960 [Deltaproteobacteria bacterium RIFCSPLOWO2_12_FULL_44_12]|nr:MAG: hypothetical protein A2712_06010 [Deltaproteobacteria bacterium RIFCSPHIGHO2_01_FULL_43_49]OGQ16684.1 MAG: hypothetical protein A3D22_07135 [Deltaproteobacteria bacterium RIFCSPHIGHO2_02_FULL_44_53]OGQ29822.1 MAG: hypothetical protein A3D98_09800 [Deltaproteobacteria bacterium RIFCSPHIGHO2_12_FULL_44_21]OGQ33112.1 MAG: hypothetical protein A2979_03780 [Deltaproteobacteria bacterium RIFCSPLOWO2_01_FULL_45_74]OGQ42207.1 MAG: hypothetical protein A3I70_06085 [Deltaproteobacteria bacterium 
MATLLDELGMVVQESRRTNLRPDVIRLKLKEKIQLYILDFIYNSPRYQNLIFYGGNCLRKCFNINRMSEDVDFESLEPFNKKQFANDIQHYFNKMGYKQLKTFTPGSGVNRVELRFPVLYQLGLSSHEAENLNIKVEVNPTDRKYHTEPRTLSEDRFSFVIKHYDLPTLMAGKMAACLERVWEKGKTGIKIKGRDYYDLIWYMQKGVAPNPDRLKETRGQYTVRGAFDKLEEIVSKIKPGDLAADLNPLFEEGQFVQRWIANFHQEFALLRKKYKP